MDDNIKNKTKKGLFWSSIERFGTQGVQFLFGIMLARLLSPSDYGIIAMPMIFLALAQVFIDGGFGSALIRKSNLCEEDLSTTFYFNIVVGICSYIILFLTSQWIADFYDTPILSGILKVTALTVLFNPLCVVQQTLLTRKIDFKTQAKVSVSAQLFTGLIGISMAYNGYGVWSLVFQQVGGYLLRTILLWYYGRWYPKTGWSRESFNYLWGFGSKILIAGLMETAYRNIYAVLIGKIYTPSELGNYTRASQFSQLPSSNITGVLQRVTYPVLSTMQDDNDRLRLNYRKLLRMTAMLIFPLMIGLSAISYPLINLLLGEKWLATVILLKIICFDMMWYPVHAINVNLLQVKGRSDLVLKTEIAKKIVGVTVLIITIPMGIVPLCVGMVISSILALVINTYYTGKLINVGFFVQVVDILPILIICSGMYIFIEAVNLISMKDYLHIIADLILGATFYIISVFLFIKKDFENCLEFLKK